MNFIQKIFQQLTIAELVARELNEARKSKLEAESARDYAVAVVHYNDMRISRLENQNDTTANKDQEVDRYNVIADLTQGWPAGRAVHVPGHTGHP